MNLGVRSQGDQEKVKDQWTKHVVLVFKLLFLSSKATLLDSASWHWSGGLENLTYPLPARYPRWVLSQTVRLEEGGGASSSCLPAVSVTVAQQAFHLSSDGSFQSRLVQGSDFPHCFAAGPPQTLAPGEQDPSPGVSPVSAAPPT